MPLYCAADDVFIEDIRRRLRVDINADLSDIFRQIKEDRTASERRYLSRILNRWFIGLFSGDCSEAKKALAMCMTLKPHRVVAPERMMEFLPIVWGSIEELFGGDFSGLMDEINRSLKEGKK